MLAIGFGKQANLFDTRTPISAYLFHAMREERILYLVKHPSEAARRVSSSAKTEEAYFVSWLVILHQETVTAENLNLVERLNKLVQQEWDSSLTCESRYLAGRGAQRRAS